MLRLSINICDLTYDSGSGWLQACTLLTEMHGLSLKFVEVSEFTLPLLEHKHLLGLFMQLERVYFVYLQIDFFILG